MSMALSIFGNYVTSATFCLKLGKGEISALGRLRDAPTREGPDACMWNLASKGLIKTDEQRMSSLSADGVMVVALLESAGLLVRA